MISLALRAYSGPCGRHSAAGLLAVCGGALGCLFEWQHPVRRTVPANTTADAITTGKVAHTGHITRTTTVLLMNKAARGAIIMIRVRALAKGSGY